MNYEPDHEQPRFGEFGDTPPAERVDATRLSILSVFSMITGVIALPVCCVPAVGTAFGLVPVLCGVGGLRAVKKGRGEVAGKGLAIGGLVMGLLAMVASTLFWAVVGSQFAKMPAVYAQVLDADPAIARTVLRTSVSTSITDEELASFREQFIAVNGENAEAPVGIWPVLSAYGGGGDISVLEDAPLSGSQSAIPVPLRTSDGRVVYLVVLASQGETLGSGLPAVGDIGFRGSDGSMVWLIGPQTDGDAASQGGGAADDGADSQPSDPPDEDQGG